MAHCKVRHFCYWVLLSLSCFCFRNRFDGFLGNSLLWSSGLLGWAMLQCSMCRGETCDRYAEGRAGNIVIADDVTPFDRVRVATVFTTDTYFKAGTGLATLRNCPIHKFADATAIDGLEGVCFENSLLLVRDQEVAFRIVTGVAIGHLGQIVRAEGEELGMSGDFPGSYCSARDLDHG